ncbi:MAG: hypothetical protein C0467_24440 [Planctomycetaceae bacterium]|nr:hypothetical protein [Planctomycetaceae bacterium]
MQTEVSDPDYNNTSHTSSAHSLKAQHCGISCLDDSLLRSWLGLPPGAWPPDHYTLLGLERGQCDPAEVEGIVLARMERLRVHQLLHPDLVTEGMNRLAQSLICLTDPVARAAYDAEREPAQPVAPATLGYEVVDEPDVTATDVTQIIEIPFAPGLAPPEVGPPRDLIPEPLSPAYELVPDDQVAVVPEPLPQSQPPARRELFARLALVRRLIAAWQKLKPALADPQESLARPVAVLLLLEAIGELRPHIEDFRNVLDQSGGSGERVLALVSQRFVLPTLRTLLPEQRRALSQDWRDVEVLLIGEYAQLRERVRQGRPVRRNRSVWQVAGWVARTPEVVLLVLTLATIIVAMFRTRREISS